MSGYCGKISQGPFFPSSLVIFSSVFKSLALEVFGSVPWRQILARGSFMSILPVASLPYPKTEDAEVKHGGKEGRKR